MAKQLIYVSRLMKAREVHEACVLFREQEAQIRRQGFKAVKKNA